MPKKRVRSNQEKDKVAANPKETPEVKPDVRGEAAPEPKEDAHPVKDGRPSLGELGPDHTAKAQEAYDWAKNVGLKK